LNVEAGKARRHPQIGIRVEYFEAWRHYADYSGGHVVQSDRFADDRGITAKTALPQAMAHHHHRVRTRFSLGSGEVAAEHRPNSPRLMGSRGKPLPPDALGAARIIGGG